MGSKNCIGGTYGVLGGDMRLERPQLGSLGRYGVKGIMFGVLGAFMGSKELPVGSLGVWG